MCENFVIHTHSHTHSETDTYVHTSKGYKMKLYFVAWQAKYEYDNNKNKK